MSEQTNQQFKQDNESFDNLFDNELLTEWDWVVTLEKLRKRKRVKLTWKNKFLVFFSVLLSVLLLITYGIYYFFVITLKKNPTDFDKQYLSLVKEYVLPYVIWTIKTNKNAFIINENDTIINSCLEIKKYLNNPWIIYYEKTDNKSEFLTEYKNKLEKKYSEINKYKDLLIKYKFLPKELSDLIKDIKIMPILITLNSIKIYITDYVFIKSGLFKEKIFDYVVDRSSFLWKYSFISKEQLYDIIVEDIQKFREIWVNIYLKDVLFNYMYDWSDKLIDKYFLNDFYYKFNNLIDNRYEFIKQKDYSNQLDNKTDFISNYVYLLQLIYDRTNNLFNMKELLFMPVDIQLISYDPTTESLTFNVKIILSDDILEKISVVDLASNVVTLLRESRLIMWKDIKFSKIKVNKTTKKVWGYKLTYKTTNLTFTTLVQSNVNVEVTDVSF